MLLSTWRRRDGRPAKIRFLFFVFLLSSLVYPWDMPSRSREYVFLLFMILSSFHLVYI